MRPEDLRGMQLQISDVLRDCASRIRNGGDLATVQKVLGEIRDSAAEFLRQTGGSQETVHLDAPGGAACADPGEDVAVHTSIDAVTCAACRAARAAEDAPGVHPLARWLARNVVLQDGVSLAIAARAAEPRRPYLGESRLAYWTALIEQAGPSSGPAFVSVAELGSGEAPRQRKIKPAAGLAGLVLALVAQHPERAAEILRLAPEDSK